MQYSVKQNKQEGDRIVAFLKEKNISCDVVAFHVFMPSFYIANKVREYFKVPMIYGIHQTDVNLTNYFTYRKKIRENIEKIDFIAYRANSLKRKFERRIKISGNSFTIPSGIPKEIIEKPDDAQERRKDFVTVANMIKRKNIDIVIKAFSRLSKSFPGIRLQIVGGGKRLKRLNQLAKRLQCNDKIEFLGNISRDKVFEILKTSDVFVLPSINETFGMVYLEAMAKGCITIGTRGEGIDGIIVDGENGFLCMPTVDGCHQKMEQVMMMGNEQKKNIVYKAYKTILNMTEEQCAREYIKHLEKTIHASF